jgi:hypothetical protein
MVCLRLISRLLKVWQFGGRGKAISRNVPLSIRHLPKEKEFMEGGWRAQSGLGRCECSGGISADIGPFRRHLHQFLNRSVHLEADLLKSVLIILANRFSANNRRKKEWQLHGVVGIELKDSVDVAVIQRCEISGDGCLDPSSSWSVGGLGGLRYLDIARNSGLRVHRRCGRLTRSSESSPAEKVERDKEGSEQFIGLH